MPTTSCAAGATRSLAEHSTASPGKLWDMSHGWSGAWYTAAPVLAFMLTALAGCGSDGDEDSSPSLPAQAERGREIVRTNGCSACHGNNGQGGVGPAFAGLYGSQVALADGSTVVADEAHLTEAIRTPGSAKTSGYDIDMPSNDLDDDEIAAVVAYIRALADAETGS